MKQIVTLEKEIAFKTMVGEISSISLEPDLSFINDSEIEGNLIISGTYKMTEASTIEEDFNYKVPVEIMLTTSLEEETRGVDINNFTYAIVNEEALQINVELIIEGLEKVEIEEESEEEVIETKEDDNSDVRDVSDEEDDSTREEIEEYCEKNNLQPRIDSTNKENIYRRNIIRNKLLPQLQELNPNIVESLSNLSKIVKIQNMHIKNEVESIYNRIATEVIDTNNLQDNSASSLQKNKKRSKQ